MATAESTHVTSGVLGARLGMRRDQIMRLIHGRRVPFTKCGRWYLILETDVPLVIREARLAGYLRPEPEGVSA